MQKVSEARRPDELTRAVSAGREEAEEGVLGTPKEEVGRWGGGSTEDHLRSREGQEDGNLDAR